MIRDRINLPQKGDLVKIELETAEVLNQFFYNIATNLRIRKQGKSERNS